MKIINYLFNFLKKIFLFIIKELFSFLIKLLLVFILIVALIGIFSEKKEKKVLKNEIYVNLDLGQRFKEKANEKNIFEDKTLNFYSLLANIEDISFNDRVKGLILKLDNLALSYAQLEELGKEIKLIKDNKNIELIAYMEEVDRKSLYIASFADKIYMPKTHSTVVNVYPYFRESFYKKGLLDKLGIKVNIVNTGDYKSYGEDYSSSHMSKEAREDTTRILNKNYEHFLNVVSENLNYSREELDKIIKNGDLVAATSEDLYKNKLITNYIYWDELVRNIGKDKIVSIDNYSEDYSNFINLPSNNKIYVMALEGEIVHSDEELLDNVFINSKSVIDTLDKIEKDDKVKGLVLRINSPGGSALTSDKISNRIKELAKKKAVYVSMGSVAASGGYYIASNATRIFADENTITGSIGVVSMIANFSDLLNKVGVNNEKIVEGKFADLYSSDKMTEEKYNKILSSNLKVYDDFLNEVSNGRKIPREKLEKLAEGRIWTGREALQIGLIDEVGGLKDTIIGIIEDLNLEDDYDLEFIEDKFDIKNIYRKYSKYLKTNKLELIQKEIYNKNLYNKPVLYYPYEIYN